MNESIGECRFDHNFRVVVNTCEVTASPLDMFTQWNFHFQFQFFLLLPANRLVAGLKEKVFQVPQQHLVWSEHWAELR